MRKLVIDRIFNVFEVVWLLALLYFFSLTSIFLPFFFILLVVSHEFGHFVLAKKYRLYKGIGFADNSIFIPCVKLKDKFPHRLDYLSGFLGSLISIPVGLMAVPLWVVIFSAFSLSLLDILVIIFYNKTNKN